MDQVTVSRELLLKIEESLESRCGTNAPERREILPQLRELLEQPAVESVSHQYQDRDGKWCNFMNEKHYENTKADGRWPIRALFTGPQPQQPIGWLRAVDEEMVSTHLGVADITDSYEDAKRKLNTLISWHVDVSHDPKVNGSAQQPAPVQEPETDWKRIALVQDAKLRAMVGESGGIERLRDVMGVYAQQPRKAVKLTPEEMKAAVRPLWPSAVMLDSVLSTYGAEYRAIEQAVLKKNGIEQ